jgi:hypothetical protein
MIDRLILRLFRFFQQGNHATDRFPASAELLSPISPHALPFVNGRDYAPGNSPVGVFS